ncbi:MAG: 2-oxoacid:acceptor oxidoreductase family protein [Candidatus Eisenbacteria bacterium]
MNEIRISGFGGQGVIRCGYIIGRIAALFDGKHATLTQSFGPEARGSACSAQILVDTDPIRYPYVSQPDTVVTMSQEAYDKFGHDIVEGGLLLIDEDLVKPAPSDGKLRMYSIPSTRIAEQLGNRIAGNIVMLGFFTAVTDVISVDAARKALPSSVPERFIDLNLEAFEKGYEYGMEMLGGRAPEVSKSGARKPVGKAQPLEKKASVPKIPTTKTAAKKAPKKKDTVKKTTAKKASKRKAAAKKTTAKKAPKKKAAAKKTSRESRK